jgi:hypothetical protein
LLCRHFSLVSAVVPAGQRIPQRLNLSVERGQFVDGQAGSLKQRVRETSGFLTKTLAFGRQMNLHLAFVGRIALARKKTSLFKPLHQGCDGTRLKREPKASQFNR